MSKTHYTISTCNRHNRQAESWVSLFILLLLSQHICPVWLAIRHPLVEMTNWYFAITSYKFIFFKRTLDNNELKNYRPVSNLSFISNILEEVVASRIQLHWIYFFKGLKRCFTQYGEGQSDSTHPPWPICCFWHSWPPHANGLLVIMVWHFWYSSWLVCIVLERPMSTAKNSGLYFWCSLYIFWCTPGLCPRTYTFYLIYCSPQSGHR